MLVREPTRPVAGSVGDLLVGATTRVPMTYADAKSSATFERVEIGGERYVVKHIDPRGDWISRWTGDFGPRVLTLWRAGMLDALPGCLDHAIEAVAQDDRTRTSALLMRDVGERLASTQARLPLEQHVGFLEHMAELHAVFWDWVDTLALTPMAVRYSMLTPHMSRVEAALAGPGGVPPQVPALIPARWDALDEAAPAAAGVARRLAGDPWPLVHALATTPATFIHGDWKAGNLGSQPDGRTILLDWGWPGAGPPLVDLAWYLAVNCDLLPQSKEDAIATYRRALRRHGVDTRGWWPTALELALLGAFVQLGWSKTDDPDELGWWAERAVHAARLLA